MKTLLRFLSIALLILVSSSAFADHRIVIDDADSVGVTVTGAWTAANTDPERFGEGYLHDQNAGKGTKSVTFTPTITVKGRYKVYGWWPADAAFDDVIEVTVQSAGSPANLTVDQTATGGQWVLFGEYTFNPGTAGNVTISNANTSSTVIADAILFVLQDEIVDNDHPTKVNIIGSWTSATATAGFWGADYVHDANAGKGSKTFWFLPEPLWPGQFDVFLRWTAAVDRADDVPVEVESLEGTDPLVVDQQNDGGKWVLLGSYGFDWTHPIAVGIGNTGTTGYVVADAIKLSISGYVVDNADAGYSSTGTWTTATSPPGFEGANFLHDGDTEKGTKTAVFEAAISDEAWYTVYLKWTSGADRAEKVPVTVTHADGNAQRYVNQKENGGEWVSVGTWVFDTTGTVTIETDSTSGYVIADSVKWTRVYDGDFDGLADAWEAAHGFDFTDDTDAAEDPDEDGLTNLEEFEQGSDPADFFNGSTIPSITKISGDAQAGDPNTWLTNPLVVEVRNASNTLLPNVPVRFSMSGSGGLSAGNSGDIASTVTLWTDANGRANCYVFTPPGYGASRTIAAKTVAGATSPQVSFTAQSNAIPSTWFKLWLKADAGVTTDGSGNVSSWSSSGGGSFSATQATAANRPALISSGLNGLPVLRFDGTNDSLGLGNVMSGATEAEIFVVLKSTAPSGQNRGFMRFGTASNSGYAFYPSSTGSIQDSFGSSTYRDTGIPVQSLGEFHLYNALSKSGLWENRFNGLLHYRTTTNTVGFTTTPSIGTSYNNFQGDIAELIVVDHVLSASERASIEAYLSAKFALAISPAAPSELSAAPLNASQLLLKWKQELTLQRTDYAIERRTASGGSFAQVALVAQSSSWIDESVTAGESYVYRIRAIRLDQSSGYSAERTASVPQSISTQTLPLADIRLWLRGDQLAPGAIGNWNNAIASDLASQNTLANRPVAEPNVVGGRAVARFDGANDSLGLGNVMTGATEGELFVILKSSATAGQARGFLRFGSASNSGYAFYPNTSGTIQDSFGSTTYRDTGAPAQSLGQFHLYNALSKSGLWENRVNGLLQFQTTSNTVGFTTTPSVGFSYNYFQGDVAELIVMDRVLNASERAAVEAYLAAKFELVAPPPTPTEVSAVPLNASQLLLKWKQELTLQRTDYAVERRLASGGSFAQIALVAQSSTWIDEGVTAGESYVYRVRAIRLDQSSGYSAECAASVPSSISTQTLPLADIRLWLRGDQLVPGVIVNWNSITAQGPHFAIQNTVANRPVAEPNVTGGRAVVRFDGTNDSLNLGAIMAGATEGELFVVLKSSASAGQGRGFMRLGSAGTNGNAYYPTSIGGIQDSFGSTTHRSTGAPIQSLSEFHLYGALSTSALWQNRLNGILHFQSATNTVGFTATPSVGYSNSYFQGDIAEVIITGRILNVAERSGLERYLGLKYLVPGMDVDADGLTSGQELLLGSNPWKSDTNGDGINDGDALAAGLSLTLEDTDGDGISNGQEIANGTDPTLSDTDFDGISDPDEPAYETDPTDSDTDNDGLNDGGEIALGSDPLEPDTDGDSMLDGWEVAHSLNPFVKDGFKDADGDRIPNLFEFHRQTLPENSASYPGPDAYVSPGQYATLQSAVNAINTLGLDWRIVTVSPGDYPEKVTSEQRRILFLSQAGAAATRIVAPSGNGAASLASDTIWDGFQFTGATQNAVSISSGDHRFLGCVFTGNSAGSGGVAIRSLSGDVTLSHCALSGNTSASTLPVVYLGEGKLTVVNSILWNAGNPEISVSSSEIDVQFSNVQGGITGSGNIDLDPGFVQGLHLAGNSPGRDDGSLGGGGLEMDGEERDSTPDMGADEWVDSDSDGLPNWWEILYGLDPDSADENNNQTPDAQEDWDGDNVSNADEFSLGGNPNAGPTTGSPTSIDLQLFTPLE